MLELNAKIAKMLGGGGGEGAMLRLQKDLDRSMMKSSDELLLTSLH